MIIIASFPCTTILYDNRKIANTPTYLSETPLPQTLPIFIVNDGLGFILFSFTFILFYCLILVFIFIFLIWT